jgi:hypothetical protein
MVLLAFVILAFIILGFTAWASVSNWGNRAWPINGPHGLSEMLYAYTSGAGNNGSAFAGLNANTPWYDTTLGIDMLLGRFGMIVPLLALAGSLARKKIVPASAGTFSGERFHVRRAARRHGHSRRRADVPARARARPDCRTFPDAEKGNVRVCFNLKPLKIFMS